MDKIILESKDINLYILFFSLVFSVIGLKLIREFLTEHSFVSMFFITFASFISASGLLTLFFVHTLFIAFFSIILGMLLGLPIYIAFFNSTNKT